MGVYSQLELQSGTGEGTRGRENRSSGAWFSFAGVSALLGWGFHEIADPVYYDASSVSDLTIVGGMSRIGVSGTVSMSKTRTFISAASRPPPAGTTSPAARC